MNIFDVDCQREDAAIVMLPVPWEATTSYGEGTAYGPELILKASAQQDLYDYYFKDNYKAGYHFLQIPKDILDLSFATRRLCKKYYSGDHETLNLINKNCENMNDYVYKNSLEILKEEKIPCVVGGDHSTPFALIQAIGETYKGDFGILHIDAHADLRKAYQDFTYSHASIMYNVMQDQNAPSKLVQVGIRDFCQEEFDRIQADKRITTFFDPEVRRSISDGRSWLGICADIVNALPKNVYISVDVDGFDPKFCPNTGTPVPGGLDFYEFQNLLHTLVGSGRKIIGFDLNEVSTGPSYDLDNEWDGNFGMRILFQVCGWCVESNKDKYVIT